MHIIINNDAKKDLFIIFIEELDIIFYTHTCEDAVTIIKKLVPGRKYVKFKENLIMGIVKEHILALLSQ